MSAPARTSPEVTLEGEGFRLRPQGPADVDDVTTACQDETTLRWLPLPRP